MYSRDDIGHRATTTLASEILKVLCKILVAVGSYNQAPRPVHTVPQTAIDGRRNIGRVLYSSSLSRHDLDDLLKGVGQLGYEEVSARSLPGIDLVPILSTQLRSVRYQGESAEAKGSPAEGSRCAVLQK